MLAMVKGRISRGIEQSEILKLIEKLIGERKYSGYSVEVYPVTKNGETTMMANYSDGRGGFAKLVFNPAEKIAAGMVDGSLVEVDVPNGKSFSTLKVGKYTKKAFAEAMISLIDSLDLSLLSEKEAKKFERRYNKYCADLEAKLEEAENRAEEKAANESDDAQDNSWDITGSEMAWVPNSVEDLLDKKRVMDKWIRSLEKKGISHEMAIDQVLRYMDEGTPAQTIIQGAMDYDQIEGFCSHLSSRA